MVVSMYLLYDGLHLAWSGLGVGDGRFPLINRPALSQDLSIVALSFLHIAHHFL